MPERRRKYIQSLDLAKGGASSEPRPSQPATSSSLPIAASGPSSSKSSSSKVGASRKSFFARLADVEGAGERAERKPDPTPEQVQVPRKGGQVKFTIEGLLSFQDTASGILLGKTAAQTRAPPRKRPNYNSNKRKFLAHIPEREKCLDTARKAHLLSRFLNP